MIEIFLASFFSSSLLFVFGNIFSYTIFNQNIHNNYKFAENSIFGVIFLSFFALILNFFIPLNDLIGTTLVCFSVIFLLIFYYKNNFKKKLFLYLLVTSLITSLIIFLSNINRPDAGLYHLPFISILNENKLIVGLSNIHFRFGHISTVQYLSAIYKNKFFSDSVIVIPLASIFSIYIYYLIENFFIEKKKK